MLACTAQGKAVCNVFWPYVACSDILSSSRMSVMIRAGLVKENWLGLNAQRGFGAALCAAILWLQQEK